MSKVELFDEELDDVTGGKITYTWDGTSGTIGINGNNNLILIDKDAFVSYYKSVQGQGLKDSQILKTLLAKGIAKKA